MLPTIFFAILNIKFAASGWEKVRDIFPEALALCTNNIQISPETYVTFVAPIDAGAFGAVLKGRIGEQDLAFKLFLYLTGDEENEITIAKDLSNEIQEVIKPMMGGVLFNFRGPQGYYFAGYAMELFEFPTISEHLAALTPEDEESRMKFLLSAEMRDLFDRCIHVMEKVWLHGVVHQDLHAENILYDSKSKMIKVFDFGRAIIPKKGQAMIFQRAVEDDYIALARSFVAFAIIPENANTIGEAAYSGKISAAMKNFAPELYPQPEGRPPTIPILKRVFNSFIERHGFEQSETFARSEEVGPSSGDGPRSLPNMFQNLHVLNPQEVRGMARRVAYPDSIYFRSPSEYDSTNRERRSSSAPKLAVTHYKNNFKSLFNFPIMTILLSMLLCLLYLIQMRKKPYNVYLEF